MPAITSKPAKSDDDGHPPGHLFMFWCPQQEHSKGMNGFIHVETRRSYKGVRELGDALRVPSGLTV